MNKNELAKELAVSEKLHLCTAHKAVDGIIRIIKETLAKGDEINLRGLASLSVTHRAEHQAVHFVTKEPITIPAQNGVKIKISKELKDLLNNGMEKACQN